VSILRIILLLFRVLFRDRSQLALENLALRQQLAILRHKAPNPRLRRADRAFWVSPARVWDPWRSALILVKVRRPPARGDRKTGTPPRRPASLSPAARSPGGPGLSPPLGSMTEPGPSSLRARLLVANDRSIEIVHGPLHAGLLGADPTCHGGDVMCSDRGGERPKRGAAHSGGHSVLQSDSARAGASRKIAGWLGDSPPVRSCKASHPFCKRHGDSPTSILPGDPLHSQTTTMDRSMGTGVRLASLGSVGPAAPGIDLAENSGGRTSCLRLKKKEETSGASAR